MAEGTAPDRTAPDRTAQDRTAQDRTAPAGASARREFAWLLLAGAAGAVIALLGTRQSVARVVVLAPRPLPAAVVSLRLADLRPAVAALAVAVLASLVAVVATRGAARRIVASAGTALAAAAAVLATVPVSRADALAAVGRIAVSPGAGSGPGSATAGSAVGGSAGEPITGLPARVLIDGAGWRSLIVAGALLVVATMVVIAVRATRLPVMSIRYGSAPSSGQPAGSHGRAVADSGAAMWESLSAGSDPTAWPGDEEP